MKKLLLNLNQCSRTGIKKFLLLMKLTLIIALLNVFQVNSNNLADPINEFSQQKQISGKVTDSNTGEPLMGATVAVKGTTLGTVTGIEGEYSLSIPNESAILVFSFIGYSSIEVPASNRTTIDVTLETDLATLDEVVVIGFGTTKKVSLTGSVAAVGSKDIKAISSTNLSTQLAGKLPGFRVTQRSGEPGAFSTAYDIRGMGTPLIVINGVVSSTDDFVRLNPNDIDQISILKDASAAIYGVQAANGVVLVTTKRGELGKPKISFTTSQSISQYMRLPDVMNAYEWASLKTQYEVQYAKTTPTYSKEDLQDLKDGTVQGTDWYKTVARDFSNSRKYNLSISGGSDRISYYSSLGASSEVGMWKSGDLNYKQYSIRTVVDAKITDNLDLGLNVEGTLANRNETAFTVNNSYETLFWHALPITTVYANNNPDYLSYTTDGLHPVAMTTADIGGYRKNNRNALNGIFTLNYNVPFIKGLNAKIIGGYYNLSSYQKNYIQGFKMYSYNELTEEYTNTISKNVPTTMSGNYTPSYRTSVDFQLNYEKTILDNHNLRATLVFEDRFDNTDNLSASKQFALDIDQFYAGLSNPLVTSNANIIASNNNQAIIGRLNYDYSGKYLVEVGFNYGGSSKFPAGKRWGFFPYTNLAWRMSNEEFFKNALPFISDFKLRGSWGILGDDAASRFQFITGYDYPGTNAILGGINVSGIGFRSIPNMDITWFTSTTKNIGFDASVKNGLLNFSVDYFRRDRDGLLANPIATIPGTVGATLSQQNLNADRTEGFEFVLGTNRRVGDFTYDISSNITYTRSKATELERIRDGNSYTNWKNNREDRWSNITWGYNYIGQFQDQDDLNNSPIQDGKGNTTLLPGTYKYEDVNGDGIIDSNDQVPIGRGNIPDLNYALSGRLTYKSFDLNLLFQGASNFNFTWGGLNRGPLPWGRNSLKVFTDCWHHEDIYDATSPWVPGRFAPANTMWGNGSNHYVSQFWMENAAYIRLKNIELGYTLKPSLASKLHLQNVRVYAAAFNLFTLSKMKDWDPELSRDTNYPLTRDFTFGLSVTF